MKYKVFLMGNYYILRHYYLLRVSMLSLGTFKFRQMSIEPYTVNSRYNQTDITKYLLIRSRSMVRKSFYLITLLKLRLQRNGYNEIPLITKSFKSHIASKLFILLRL